MQDHAEHCQPPPVHQGEPHEDIQWVPQNQFWGWQAVRTEFMVSDMNCGEWFLLCAV